MASRQPLALVIGADQLVAFEGPGPGQAPPRAAARAAAGLRGATHDILTGLCVVGPGFLSNEADAARLTVLPPSDEGGGGLPGPAVAGLRREPTGWRGRGRPSSPGWRDRTAIQGLPMQRVVRSLPGGRGGLPRGRGRRGATGGPPHPALTIAGSDPSGRAGLQADPKTFPPAPGVRDGGGVAAHCAVPPGVARVEVLAAELVGAQLDHLLADITPGGQDRGPGQRRGHRGGRRAGRRAAPGRWWWTR